jgi:hypothetical protein
LINKEIGKDIKKSKMKKLSFKQYENYLGGVFKLKQKKAFTLAYVLFFSTLLLSVILIALSNHTMNMKKMRKSGENYDLRAYEVAKAGLIDTLYYFRKQSSQPVLNFNPTSTDSQDPSIGIVNTLNITSSTNNIIGRYTVDRNLVRDVSSIFNKPRGTIWEIVSEGQIIKQARNEVIADKRLAVLIRRISISVPYESTVTWQRASNVNLQSRTRMVSSNPAFNITCINGWPTVNNQSALLPYAINYVNNYTNQVSVNNVFGININEIKGISDYIVNNINDFPNSFKYKIIYILPNSSALNLSNINGSGIIITQRSLIFSNYINFSGIIYVMNNASLTFNCPGTIFGTIMNDKDSPNSIIAFNNTSGSDFLLVQYDRSIIQKLRNIIGNYRFYSSFYKK